MTGSGEKGAVRLHSARVGGQLDLRNAEVTNNTGPALFADGLQADSDLRIDVCVTGSGEEGAVRLLGARVGGQLGLRGASPMRDGPALFADGLQADSDLRIDGARVTGSGEEGAVRLLSARVGGQLDLDDAEVTNNTGPALFADGLRADSEDAFSG